MDETQKLQIYQAQVENTRSLNSSMSHVHRAVNQAFRSNDEALATTFTKTYALLFCAWTEANFSKVIHTPYGFCTAEIDQIKMAKNHGISKSWEKAVELGLRHLDAKRGNFKPNTQKKLYELIESHVFEPSTLRNKLAHGQWKLALNRENNHVEQVMTQNITDLDIVKIQSWREGHKIISEAVETLIESPKKAFPRNWHEYVVKIEEKILDFDTRTIEHHVAKLKKKKSRFDKI